jgi:hypothetical protein
MVLYGRGALVCVVGCIEPDFRPVPTRPERPDVFAGVVAGINCLHIPLGTVLGVFTIVVLIRDSVRELYSARF